MRLVLAWEQGRQGPLQQPLGPALVRKPAGLRNLLRPVLGLV